MAWTSLKHRYSYSGSDAKAFAYFKANSPGYAFNDKWKGVQLEAMHTISFSIFEAKGRVRSLGFKSIRGFTRAVREISGTMIMMVIEDHPLAGLMAINPSNRNEVYGISDRSWSLDGRSTAIGARSNAGPHADYFEEQDQMRRAPTTLPPFNIMIEYNTEVPDAVIADGPGLGKKVKDKTLYGVRDSAAIVELIDVEIMGQGIVTSVNDMVTEVQYQFVARDYREFMKEDKAIEETWYADDEKMLTEANNRHVEEVKKKNKQVEVNQKGEVKITTSLEEATSGLDKASEHILKTSLKENPKKQPIGGTDKKIDQVGGGGTSGASIKTTSAADMQDPKKLEEAKIKTWDINVGDYELVSAHELPSDHPLLNGLSDDSRFVNMSILPAGENPDEAWVDFDGYEFSENDRYQVQTIVHGETRYTMVDVADAIEYSELRNALIAQGDLNEAK